LFGWRSIVFVNLPIGLAALWLTWRQADETTSTLLGSVEKSRSGVARAC
jgi:DHA2 family methylenomycin A resistance protein-like MFS transporter